MAPQAVVLTAGRFHSPGAKASAKSASAKKAAAAAATVPYTDSLVDTEASALVVAHRSNPVEVDLIMACAATLKARAASFAAKGTTVQAILPVLPSEDRLFEVEVD